MKYSAVDIANYFISLYKYDEEHPTNLKLNKMVYFAQGHALARLGHTLFDERIEAWNFGPVEKSVYNTFKKYGKSGIETPSRPLPSFGEEDENLLLDVARRYGRFTGSALTSMTHRKGSPWSLVYNGNKNVSIPIDSIKSYFLETEEPLLSIDEELGELNVVEWNDVV